MWKGLYDLQTISQEWANKVLKTIDVKPMMQQVEKYFRIVAQCERNLGDNPIVPKLKTMVLQYK